MTSKLYPRRPMHRRDETSNAPPRQDVQCTVETKCPTHRRNIKAQWKSRVGQVQQRNRKFSVGSDNPRCLWSDKHSKEPGLSDTLKFLVGFWVVALLREHVFRDWKMPMRSDYPMLGKLKVGQRLGWFCREPVFSWWNSYFRIGLSDVVTSERQTNGQ
jgi:hypothetical protein